MSRPIWFVQLVKKMFPGRFLLARATWVPLLGELVDRWLFWEDHLIYLPRDRVVSVGQPIDQPGEMVLPSQVVEHYVRDASFHWLMESCICRDSSGCEDYPVELGCLFLGRAAEGINPKLGRKVTRQEALTHLQRCREAGLVHMVGRNKLDQVWLGVGPGEKLLTICNCCPCCCLWRVLPSISSRIASKVTRMPGVSLTVNDRCTGCGMCVGSVCFTDAIQLVDGRAMIDDRCRACGRCVEICSRGAIEISIDADYMERTIDRISPLVDLS